MKFFFALSFVISVSTYKASAQYGISAKEAVRHLNDSVKVCDYVSKMTRTPDSTILLLGKGARKNVLKVILKGSANQQLEPRPSGYPVGFQIVVWGFVRNLKGRPYMVVSDTFDNVVTVH